MRIFPLCCSVLMDGRDHVTLQTVLLDLITIIKVSQQGVSPPSLQTWICLPPGRNEFTHHHYRALCENKLIFQPQSSSHCSSIFLPHVVDSPHFLIVSFRRGKE